MSLSCFPADGDEEDKTDEVMRGLDQQGFKWNYLPTGGVWEVVRSHNELHLRWLRQVPPDRRKFSLTCAL